MKIALAALIAAALAVYASARAAGGDNAVPVPAKPVPALWDAWREPVRPPQPRPDPPVVQQAPSVAADEEIDVVDAHWMALTMWGEARSGGEEAMRAVGHVIDNRRRSGAHGAYATETVSEAWQFSCWNKGDPNYAAMLDVDSLPPDSEDQLMWLTAKRVAEEILSGRSADPTGGALFYHTAAVSPRWSAGLTPVRVIGGHLFFRTARGA
jgi:spore germination cell wall hydrolase CwlJ-like protein